LAIWDLDRTLQIANTASQRGPVERLAFSPDGRVVLSASRDTTSRLCDTRSGERIAPSLPNLGRVTNFTFSPDGSYLASMDADDLVRMWNLAGYCNTREQRRPQDDDRRRTSDFRRYSYKEYYTDGDRDWNDSGVVYTSPTISQQESRLRECLAVLPPQKRGAVLCAAVSPDARRLVTLEKANGFDSSKLEVWDAKTGRIVGASLTHEASVIHAEFSPDGRLLVTASERGSARLWDAQTGRPVGNPMRHGRILFVGFSPNGTRLVTTSVEEELSFGGQAEAQGRRMMGGENSAQLWDTATTKPIGPRLRHVQAVNRAAFSPDGGLLATASSAQTARLWKVGSGRPLGQPIRHDNAVIDVSFSSDGQFLLTKEQ
jgi:WD40 repeat protein